MLQKFSITIFSLLALGLPSADAATKSNDHEVESQILAADADVFDRGYNKCDLTAFEQAVSEDFEFYHDQGGITRGRNAFLISVEKFICRDSPDKVYRRLIHGTSVVFPLRKNGEVYGAIHNGDHSFYILDENGVENPDSTAAFSTLWMLESGVWKMRRVLSYDHNLANARPPFLYTGYRSKLFDNDDDVEKLMERLGVPTIAMARIKGGSLQQIRVFGELSEGRAAPIDTMYKVASLTKPITTILTLKLVDAGLWDLDKPLNSYYVDPDVRDSPELDKLTTRHVLSHRTGFMNWRYLKDDNTLRFEFEPGAKQQYSGEGMEYLRKALEAKFNKPMEELAEQYLFKPLGMKNTHFAWTNGLSDQNYAFPLDRDGQVINEKKHRDANAAANLLTTIEDYSRFSIHVLDGAGLSKGLYKEMVAPSSVTGDQIPYGLGWMIMERLGDKGYALQHTGSDAGVKTIVLLFPETGDGMIFFTNSDNGISLYVKAVEEGLPGTGKEIIERLLKQ